MKVIIVSFIVVLFSVKNVLSQELVAEKKEDKVHWQTKYNRISVFSRYASWLEKYWKNCDKMRVCMRRL